MRKGICCKFVLLYIKNGETNYYQRNRETILRRAKEYLKNGKKRLREQAINKCRQLSEKENNKKREYGRYRYKNMSEGTKSP